MNRNINYFFAQAKYNIKNAHALSHSFWFGIVGMMVNNSAFFIIWLLFMQATGPINGWTGLDVFGMLGISMVCFGITHGFFYGTVDLPKLVERGSFDTVLLSPVSILSRLSGMSFSITAYGDLLLGSVVSILYGIFSNFDFTTWVLYIFAIAIGCVIFFTVQLLCASIVFFIRDSEVISKQLFEIFLRPGLYPGGIFPSKMKIFFMTVVPALLTSAMPVDVIKTKSLQILFLAIGVTAIWIIITTFVFKKAVKRYESGNFLR